MLALTCSSVHASTLHPLLAHHHLCYVDVYCVFFLLVVFLLFSFFSVCLVFSYQFNEIRIGLHDCVKIDIIPVLLRALPKKKIFSWAANLSSTGVN